MRKIFKVFWSRILKFGRLCNYIFSTPLDTSYCGQSLYIVPKDLEKKQNYLGHSTDVHVNKRMKDNERNQYRTHSFVRRVTRLSIIVWRHCEMREVTMRILQRGQSIVTSWQCQPNIFDEKNICEAKFNVMN